MPETPAPTLLSSLPRRLAWAGGALLVAAAALLAGLSQGASLTVTTTQDISDGNTSSITNLLASPGADGRISLREAITAANNTTGTDTITLPAGTYTLTAGELSVTKTLIINGASSATTVISGNLASRIFTTGNASLTLTNMTLTKGRANSGNGGAILRAGGTLRLTSVILEDNAANNGNGGAVYGTSGTHTYATVSMVNNRAALAGGAVYKTSGTLVLTDVSFTDNQAFNGNGGAVWMAGTRLTMTRGTVRGNTGYAGNGGGLYVSTTGASTMTGSTLSSNRATNGTGGGAQLEGNGTWALSDTTVSGNSAPGGGGGLALASGGNISLTRVTLDTNAAANGAGGGLLVSHSSGGAITTATNVTLYGNSAGSGGGGAATTLGKLSLVNVTVAANSASNGAGGLRHGGGEINTLNTLVAANTGSSGNCSGTVISTGYSIDTGTSCGFTGTGDRSSANAALGSFGANGSTASVVTHTVAIGAGSAAVNAGTATGAPVNDQRGLARLGGIDVGAFEFGGGSTGSSIGGTVFEDLNYGGGAGRNLATAQLEGASGRPGALVELYDSGGNLVRSTSTAGDGSYAFTFLPADVYTIRVVNGSVSSARTGYLADLVPVQTYRVDASSGSVVAVSDRVGGQVPAREDADAGSTTLSALTTATTTAQSITSVKLGATPVTGIDFGFSFNVVVNTNDIGQGSLSQVVDNTNALANAGLAISGRTAGIDHVIFMLPDGTARPGQNSGYASAFSGGVASIGLSDTLPVNEALVIDGQTQPGWTTRPVIELNGNPAAAGTVGIATAVGGNTLRGLIINRFDGGGVVLNGGGNVLEGCWIGTASSGSSASANNAAGVLVQSGSGDVIGGVGGSKGNVISGNAGAGIVVQGSATVIQGNRIGQAAATASNLPNAGGGVLLSAGTGARVGSTAAGAGNVIAGNTGRGVGVANASSGNTIRGNSIFSNTSLGIDLGNDGATANDGGKTNGSANLRMDKPVITRAGLGGSTLAVVGYVGSAALQATFGAATVDVYISDGASNPGGQTWVGTLTANADGEFAGVLSTTGLSGLVAGTTQITATATDAGGNTSEFSANAATVAVAALQNGGFEAGVSAGSTYITRNTGDTSGAPPWVVTGNSVEVIGGYWQPAEGIRSLDLSGGARGGVAQVVQTVAGQPYTVRFALSANAACGTANKVLRVSAVGQGQTVSQTYNAASAGRTVSAMGWQDQTLSFTAVSDATVLWFESLEVSACGPALDNVRLGAGSGSVAGTVFEDLNYGGGAGRNRSTALANGGALRPAARVEIYSVAGSTATYFAATTTDGSGAYQFTALPSGNYLVRVVSNTVTSSRTGATPGLLPVATFMTDASTGVPADRTDLVGGPVPAVTSAATQAGTTGGSTPLPVTYAEATSSVAVGVGAGVVTGVDFGFNFNTVTNTNDSGAGSLRQVITNANALGGEASLAQAGRTAGQEHVVFMISNGSASAGLRAANNLFTTRAGNHAVAALAPASPLPSITSALTLDAQTQPGWSGLPLLDVDGTGAGSTAHGLTIAAAQTTVRGFVLRRFALSGLSISGNSVTVQGNHLGTNAAGTVAEGNLHSGLISTGTGTVVGGNSASQRNLISGNGLGLHLSGSDAVITGNYIGTNATGTGKLPNTAFGVGVMASVPARIGGTTVAERNVIGGNGTDGIYALGTPTIQGNWIGLGADGSANVGNARHGILANCSGGGAVGGTLSGAGNVIANSGANGVLVTSTCRTLPIRGNSMYGHAQLGIDLGDTSPGSGVGNGTTANDGAKSATQANQWMDAPVFTSATLAGSTLTLAGHVGSAAGQALFAASTVEVFVADAGGAAPAGRTYLGSLTTDASGNLNGTVTLPVGTTFVSGTTALVGTATDGSGNTSEFGPALVFGRTVAGTVYEDLNYGGGAGRSRAASGGVGVANATVELIGSDGLLKASTTTAVDGSYRFVGVGEGHYVARVVLASVRSTRSGSSSAAVGVQTWRQEASWTSPGPVTDEVGGADPAAADGAAGVATYTWTACAAESATCSFSGTRLVRYGANSTWTTRVLTGGTACNNAVFGDPLVSVAKSCQLLNASLHSASSVSTLAGNVAGVDFGFNFNTVVNTNASGAGSLQQVVTNANALGGDSLLAQAGRSAGVEHVVFMVPNGSAAGGTAATGGKLALGGGLRPGLNAFSGGLATITPGSRLLVSQSLVIDAQTQPGWTANPVVELVGTGAPLSHSGVELSAGTTTVRGLVVNRWPEMGIHAYGGSGHVVQGNWLGTDRTGNAAAANAKAGLVAADVGSMQIGGTSAAERNVMSGNGALGLAVVGNGSGVVVQGNFIGTNAAGTAALANASAGVYLESAGVTVGGTASGAGNVISGNSFEGLWIDVQATGVTVRGNRIGTNAAGTAAVPNLIGIAVVDAAGTVIGGSDPAARNLVSGNSSFGIDIQGSATGTVVQGNFVGPDVTGNARIGNGSTGIVLRAPGVTIGGVGAGNVVSGNGGLAAIDVLATATGAVIQGNTLGLGADGSTALTNPWDGLQVRATGVQVGGTAAGAGNVIGGFNAGASGIAVFAGADNVVIEGNTIGLNAARTLSRPNGHGVWFQAGTRGGRVGGPSASAANVIAGNAMAGVAVVGSTSAVRIQRNSIWGQTGLGIDLSASNTVGDGVTPNDGLQASGEPNRGMDFPVLGAARARGDQLTVTGYVGLSPGTALFAGATVDVYAGDGSVRPSGRTWLGSLSVASDGRFSGTVTMPVPSLSLATVLTATATDGSGNTSEFGPAFTGLVVDFVVDTNADDADLTAGDGECLTAAGRCSLRAAITELNAQASLAGTPTIVFALPGCSAAGQAACRIAPVTVLPTVARPMAIDGSTQPGWSATTAAPLVELSGATAPANAIGLVVNASDVTLRGLVINRWGSHGLSLGGSNNRVVGNWFGLDASGISAAANGGNGINVTGSGARIGGSTLADRNVASGNVGSGIALVGSGNVVTGNVAGLLPDGSGLAANGVDGIYLGASGQLVGGSAAGEGNVASGNVRSGIRLVGGSDNSVIEGNCVGVAADCRTARGNGLSPTAPASGIGVLGGAGSRISANVIANSGIAGVGVGAVLHGVSILGNSIYANAAEGIRLNVADANDGVYNNGQANRGMDNPVITGAGIDNAGTSMTVFGYIGTGTGQAAFAGARVELFRAAPDASGYGEGQVYLGALTADGNGRFSGTIPITLGQAVVGDIITGTATDGSGNTSEFGPNWVSTTTAALTPAGFNAFETDTPLTALTGAIRSKVAGTPAPLAVVALNSAGLALHAGFTGTVALTWLDARDDSGPVAGSCRGSWTSLGSAGTASFSNNARVTATVTPPATGTRVMRLKMSFTNGAATVEACSTDAFAALPASLALSATDGSAASAGTARSLDTTTASGGAVHQAGRPFTLTAQALDATGAVMTGYTGTPTVSVAGCLLPAGCTAGALTSPVVAAVAGVYSNPLVSYAEVGAISVRLTDTDYASVDAADTAADQRTVASALLPVGRFVPDSLELTVSAAGRLATANGSCMAAGQGATFFGQGFGWHSAPQVTVTARNAAGGVTALWTGALMKLAASTPVPALAVASAGSATAATSFGPVAVTDLGGGRARVDASGTDRFVLDLPAGSVQPTVTPTWTWSLAVSDASEAGVAGNPVLAASASQPGVPFDRGAPFHSGRLALSAGHGDARVGVRSLLQLQRWTAAGWVTATEDRGCITVQPQHLGVELPAGVFVSSGRCAAPLGGAATTQGGRAWLTLPATPGAAPGRLALRVAGTGASGNSCTAGGALAALQPLDMPWLLGGPAGAGPLALLTWGAPNRDVVLRRETW